MNIYYIPQIIAEPQWSSIPYLHVEQNMWLPDVGVRMTQQICYDKNAIYIHQTATEENIRAELIEPLANVYEDSCMEFFFCPDANSERYFNFEWNLNGCLYLGFHNGSKNAVRLISKNPVTQFSFQSHRTSAGWEIFYQIPLDFIQMFFPSFRLAPGVTIRANCYKCGDKTAHPHYLSWNPCTSEEPNFHRPSDFGVMVLAEKPISSPTVSSMSQQFLHQAATQ